MSRPPKKYCARCRTELTDRYDTDPCPACGSWDRALPARDHARARESVQLRGTSISGEVTKQLTNTGNDHLRDAELAGQGITWRMMGGIAENEEGSEAATQRLIEHLNRAGGRWKEPRCTGNEPVEIISCAEDGEGTLEMQVVRALYPDTARRLRTATGMLTDTDVGGPLTISDAADALWQAVQQKMEHYPLTVRRDLVLVVDVAEYPALAWLRVVDVYRTKYREQTISAGFSAIWVVGMTCADVYPLA